MHAFSDSGRRQFMRASGLVAGAYAGGLAMRADGENVTPPTQTPDASKFNVKLHGAVGDGVKDDTPALQKAVDLAAKSGGVVFFPVGRYKTTDSLQVRASSVVLCGEGAASVLAPSGDFDTVRFEGAAELY